MKWRFEDGGLGHTIPLEGYLFLWHFELMTIHDEHARRAGLFKLVDLALRSAHLARLHFEVWSDNKLYFEKQAVNSPPRSANTVFTPPGTPWFVVKPGPDDYIVAQGFIPYPGRSEACS